MIETNYAVTQAIRVLKEKEVPFVIHSYKYEEHGGTPVAARELGVDEHAKAYGTCRFSARHGPTGYCRVVD